LQYVEAPDSESCLALFYIFLYEFLGLPGSLLVEVSDVSEVPEGPHLEIVAIILDSALSSLLRLDKVGNAI